jgi:BCCT family betaine/carnitine transporter
MKITIVDKLGGYYLLIGAASVTALLWLIFGKYRNLKLGDLDTPKMNNFTWGALIYTSTMAADILFYAFHEWIYYYQSAALIADGSEKAAVELAYSYPLFHWGITPWSFYILPAVAYAYFMFVRKRNVNKMSDAITITRNPILLKIIDVISTVSILISVSVTLTISTPLIPASIADVLGIEMSPMLSIAILLIIAVMFIVAVLFKMKGIEKLAEFNVYGYFLLFAIFIFSFNGLFIFEAGLSAIGYNIQNFVRMSLFVDPARLSGGFTQDWTTFYWAYWIAWAVATPIFIGKISEGRTIRQMILGGMGAGLLGTMSSFIIFGNFGLANQVAGRIDAIAMLEAGKSVESVIIASFNTLPYLSAVVLIIVAIVMMVENASTLDAIILVTAEASYRRKADQDNPSKRMKIYWSILFIVLPIVFILNESKLYSLQTLLIVMGLPMSFILIAVVVSFFRSLRKREDQDESIGALPQTINEALE